MRMWFSSIWGLNINTDYHFIKYLDEAKIPWTLSSKPNNLILLIVIPDFRVIYKSEGYNWTSGQYETSATWRTYVTWTSLGEDIYLNPNIWYSFYSYVYDISCREEKKTFLGDGGIKSELK